MISNPEAVAWAIAADGYITFRKNHNSFQPRIGIANTNKEFIYKFHVMVSNIGRVYYYKHPNPKHKGKWFWELYSIGDCLAFLLEVSDYLPIKQEQANIIILYCIRALDKIKEARSFNRLSPEWRKIYKSTQEDLDDYNSMKELNQRGVK